MGYVSISEALPIDVGVGATRVGRAGDAVGDCAFAWAIAKMTESNVRTELIFVLAEKCSRDWWSIWFR